MTGEDSYIRRFTISIEAQERQFTLSERSRGFQWFVCFVLFTQIRLHRDKNGTIFLLDEPKISCYKTCEYDETKHQHSF